MPTDEPGHRRSSSRGDKTRDPRTVKKFLEELSWILNSYSNLDFRAINDLSLTAAPNRSRDASLGPYVSKNPNIHFLIGVLPGMFANEQLFPSNEDIVEFSRVALNLPISRWEKRSRYELIGRIVCEAGRLDDEGLDRLARALRRLVSDDPNAERLTLRQRGDKLNWNEIIQMLIAEEQSQDAQRD